MTGKGGATVSHCAPANDPYVPNVAAASPADRAKAQRLLDQALAWCRSARISGQTMTSNAGRYTPSSFNHHWAHRPDFRLEFTPGWAGRPKMAVLNGGKLVGAFYVVGKARGFPLAQLGTIPRPHVHGAQDNEMLHIWTGPACNADLRTAFTAKGPWHR